MILVLWLARLLDILTVRSSRAASAVYRRYYSHQARKAARACQRREREKQHRVDAAIDDVIAETRSVKRVGSPIHRDR